MYETHMTIHLVASREGLRTDPADMRLALRAHHVVASCVAFNQYVAPRKQLEEAVASDVPWAMGGLKFDDSLLPTEWGFRSITTVKIAA